MIASYNITDEEFKMFQKLVLGLLGIRLIESKKPLILSRLSSRLRELELNTLSEYITYLQDETNGRNEIINFINKITTNETYFFREEGHFEYLLQEGFAQIAKYKTGFKPDIRIWSAACSSGEEPYSIAMIAHKYFPPNRYNIKILATDINTEVLEIASQGIFEKRQVDENVPQDFIKKYFRPSSEHKYIISDTIKSLVTFKRLNLLDKRYPIKNKIDIIFCRNVMIYFDESTKRHVISQFAQYLHPKGLLLIGHSETLFNYGDQFSIVKNTIYQKAHDENNI